MSAITTVMAALSDTGNRLLMQKEVYRKNRFLATNLFSKIWASVEWVDVFDTLSYHPQDGDVIFLELPSNPRLLVPRLLELRQIGGEKLTIVADLTLAGLGNETKQMLSATDIIIHSLTKFVGGHNDVFGGTALIGEKYVDKVWDFRSALGTIIQPAGAEKLLRSLRTYEIRFARQLETAAAVATHLGGMDRVREIYFPGYGANSWQRDQVSQLLNNAGAVVSFTPKSSLRDMQNRLPEMLTIVMAASFGSTDSLFEFPRTMSLSKLSDEELADLGIEENLVRLSLGLEDSSKILADLEMLTRV